MPFLIFFHSILGLFVEMDSIKQVSSMAVKETDSMRGRGRLQHQRKANVTSSKQVMVTLRPLTLELVGPNDLVRGAEDYPQRWGNETCKQNSESLTAK